jgi:diguanylate cyclase (GGDEF)-like protein
MSRGEPTGTKRSSAGSRPQDRALRVLMSLVDDITVETDERGLLRTTLEHVVESLGLTGGITFVLRADQELVPAAERWPASGDRVPPVDLARSAVDMQRPAYREQAGEGWFAATPLMRRGRPLGALVLRDARPEAVLPDAALLEALGKQIGAGLENVRLVEALRASAHLAGIANRITASFASGTDLKVALAAFAREVAGVYPFDRLAWGFVNDAGDYLEVVAHPEDVTWGWDNVVPVVGSSLGSAALNNRAVLSPDLLHNRQFIEDMRLLEKGVRSYVVVPLNARGHSIGALALGSNHEHAYDEGIEAPLQTLADSIALALENARLLQKTRELSITDDVTPLYNYRFFHQIIDRELKLVDRYHSVLSLVFLDLDDFKPINDNYGHLRGSRVLREVGFLLRAAVRETDYPVRYGGDEFVLVLPQTDAGTAAGVAQKLRELIEGHTYLQEEGINARIGVSIGVATYPTDATSKETLVRLADERMYHDKERRKTGDAE